MRRLALLLTLALLGCPSADSGAGAASAPASSGPVALVFAPGGRGFFDLPWPLDARRGPEGRPDLDGLPNPRGEAFLERIRRLAEVQPGFSPTGTISFRFDGPLRAPVDDPLASVTSSALAFVVDVDPRSPERGRRAPVHVALTERADSFRPAHLLQLLPVPGRGLRVNTTYAALVLRDLGDARGEPLALQPTLRALLAGETPPDAPSGPGGEALARAYAPLVAALPSLGLTPDDVAAATVFTTGDPTARLRRQVAHVSALPPLAPSEPLRARAAFEGFVALEGALDLPLYQDGSPPYLFWGGRQVTDAQGLPVKQGAARAPFQLSIPSGPMPPGGYPLYLYVHGTGGVEGQAIDRGRQPARDVAAPPGSGLARDAAAVGWATACVAGPFSPTRLGALAADGYLAYNFLNPVALRDNFAQMILEQVQFLRALLALRIDPALCPQSDASAAPDGVIRFDPARLVVGGQSLGSYLSGMLGALLPDWKGVILSGAGGSWVEFAFSPRVPFRLIALVEALALPLGERLDRFHPMIMAFDLACGPADNTHYLRHLVREPLEGQRAPHVLVVEGHDDLQVGTNLQRALALAIGVDFVGDDPGPAPEHQVVPVLPWGGLARLSYPAGANRRRPDGSPLTALMVRYAEDGITEGHHVVFQLERPRAQLRDFLQAVAAGEAPTVR